jgi:hypothetical protein
LRNQAQRAAWAQRLTFLRRAGTSSLSIFTLESVLSQALATLLTWLVPSWNQTIGICILFGVINAAIWAGIVKLWARYDYRYSMEWLTVRFYARFNRPSNKLNAQIELKY